MDFYVLEGSFIDSHCDSRVELDCEPGFLIDYGFVPDFDSTTSSDSATKERSQPSIL